MKKTVLILFPLPHIAFSPTTLGLYDALAEQFNVTIFCPLDPRETGIDLKGRKIQYFPFDTSRVRKIKALPLFISQKLNNLIKPNRIEGNLNIYDFVRFLEYKKAIKNIGVDYDEVIAVDMMLLYLSQSIFKETSFLSLELTASELPFLKVVPADFIKCVIIQSEQRYKYLFGEMKLKTFFIQNAPVYKPLPEVTKEPNAFLFNGTATPWFGLYHCLNFIKQFPEFSLTFKGVVLSSESVKIKHDYGELIKSENIIMNKEYTESGQMLRFMAGYEIGFCFYDLSYPKMNTFNYQTAPSGKMFAYFAAGVPVIGNDLEGLKIIKQFEAGILIKDFRAETIYEAQKKIKNNYAFYRENCFKAAAYYSFDKNVKPFREFLLSGRNEYSPHSM